MEEDPGLRVGAPAEVAAGPRSVVKSLRTALGRMGPVRSVRTLARVNQKDGFACPPAPGRSPSDRHIADFCENGVKAVAEEAMKARVTRAFFERYDIAQLAEQSDYWLGQRGRLTEPMVKRSGSNRYEPIAWDDAFGLIADELGAARLARRGDLLHVRAHEQRGGVLLPALRPGARDEQPARLLEPLPRVERRRAHGDARRRQGQRLARGHPRRRPDLRSRPEPGHEPPAHADRARDRQAARRADRDREPAARARPDAVQEPADGARPGRARDAARGSLPPDPRER